MALSNEELYAWLRPKLAISKLHLDEHLIEIGTLILQANEALAASLLARDAAKRDLDFVTANREALIRDEMADGKKLSEAAIKSEVTLAMDVQEAQAEIDACKHDVSLWQGMNSALDAHQASLRALVQLAGQGYFSINDAATEIKAEMAAKRSRMRTEAT